MALVALALYLGAFLMCRRMDLNRAEAVVGGPASDPAPTLP